MKLPVGEEGTIYFEGENQFTYHNDPKKTAESRHPAHAELVDAGRCRPLDEDGYLYLTDRKAFMIISGGVNIYPQEAENLLITHPKVADVAVIGVPNEDFGEEVKAVVQPADWSDAGPELAEELIAYCRETSQPHQMPAHGRFRRGAAAPSHRQALQAADPRQILGQARVAHCLTKAPTVCPADGLLKREHLTAERVRLYAEALAKQRRACADERGGPCRLASRVSRRASARRGFVGFRLWLADVESGDQTWSKAGARASPAIRRHFCLTLSMGRGTPDRPGLMLGLDERRRRVLHRRGPSHRRRRGRKRDSRCCGTARCFPAPIAHWLSRRDRRMGAGPRAGLRHRPQPSAL